MTCHLHYIEMTCRTQYTHYIEMTCHLHYIGYYYIEITLYTHYIASYTRVKLRYTIVVRTVRTMADLPFHMILYSGNSGKNTASEPYIKRL